MTTEPEGDPSAPWDLRKPLGSTLSQISGERKIVGRKENPIAGKPGGRVAAERPTNSGHKPRERASPLLWTWGQRAKNECEALGKKYTFNDKIRPDPNVPKKTIGYDGQGKTGTR